jgi:hypothetical protein
MSCQVSQKVSHIPREIVLFHPTSDNGGGIYGTDGTIHTFLS